jgi:uncharacterized membrane protein
MSGDDWLLALHLVAAFAFVAALIGFWAMIIAAWKVDRPAEVLAVFRINPVFTVAVAVGSIGSIVFGIWLAISLDAYEVWDGWVIAAIVLWAVAGAVGGRASAEYGRVEKRARELVGSAGDQPDGELRALVRTRQGLAMHSIATVAVVLILIDMVWKPGA